MGYSVVTTLASDTSVTMVEFRFTMWVDFNTPAHPEAPDWSDSGLRGMELYVHGRPTANGAYDGDLQENVNEAANPTYKAEVAALVALLKRGPTGGWGPWQQKQGAE